MEKVIFTQLSIDDIRVLFREEITNAISELNQPSAAKHEVLNFKDGCKHIDLSESHVYKLTSTQQIPHAKRGKRIFFDKAELDNWLLSNKVKDQDQIDKEAAEYLSKKGRR